MSAENRIPPAPVGQQAPPTRAASPDSGRSFGDACGSLPLTTGTGSHRDRVIIRIDGPSWQQGYDAGLRGVPYRCGQTAPDIADRWSWISGYIEGQARRYQQCRTSNENRGRP